MQLASAGLGEEPQSTVIGEVGAAEEWGRKPWPPDSGVALLPGRSFGEYDLLEEIARGGMGIVYKARQRSLDRTVALKVLLLGELSSESFIERFRVEAQATASLKHPNIVSVHEIGSVGGQHYFSMEYVDGQDLAQFVREKPLLPKKAAGYVKVIAEAIQSAHGQGILHRDLKPSNVLIDKEDCVRVTDFGLAKRLDKASGQVSTSARSDLTLTGQVLGTPNYMSPEQAMGESELSVATDVYALGGVLYYLLTGRPPFQADTLTQTLQLVVNADPVSPRLLNGSVPADLETICLKCLEKHPLRRFDSAEELGEELGRFLRDEPIRSRPVSRLEKLWRWCCRNPTVAALSMATALLVLSVAVGAPIAALQIAAQREALRLSLYAADMKAAQVALQQNSRGQAIALLNQYRPKPGQGDLRGIEWRHLWGAAKGDELYSWQHPNMTFGVRFSPDGKRLATTCHDNYLRVWDVNSKELVAEVYRGANYRSLQHNTFCFSPDGSILALEVENGIALFDCRDWSLLKQLDSRLREGDATPAHLGGLSFSPEGKLLLASLPGAIMSWTTAAWERNLVKLPFSAPGAAFASNRPLAALVGRNESVRLWNFMEHRLIRELEGMQSIWWVAAISPSGEWVAGASYDGGNIGLWELETGRMVWTNSLHQSLVNSLVFSPDGKVLASAGNDQTIHLLDMTTRELLAQLRGHQNEIWSLDFSPDGRFLASCGKDGTVKLWNAQPAPSDNVWWLSSGHIPLGFDATGRRLITLATNGLTVEHWEKPMAPKSVFLETPVPLETVNETVLSPKKTRIFSGKSPILCLLETNNNVAAFSLESGKRVHDVKVAEPLHSLIKLSPDERWLAGLAPVERSLPDLLVWNFRTGERVAWFRDFPRHGGNSFLGFSPDGKWLAQASTNYQVKVWEVATQRLIWTLSDHKWNVGQFAFSPDGNYLATGSWDEGVRVWNLATGKLVVPPLRGHGSGAGAIFSTDSRSLVTRGGDATIRVWNILTGREMLRFTDVNPTGSGGSLVAVAGEQWLWQDRTGAYRIERIPSLAEIDKSARH